MKTSFRFLARLARGLLVLAGILALLAGAAQFTPLPWRAFKSLMEIPAPDPAPPALILVMGGSGIPGESGLMRTYYAAQAAAEYPRAEVLVAMPLAPAQSESSRAYLAELRLRGVASPRLRILDGGRNTREQALRLAEYLAGRRTPAHILIISSPEHLRRAAAAIRQACIAAGRPVALAARPAYAVSIEDPLPWRAADLDSPGPASPARAAIPDIGSSLRFRYNLWANLDYSTHALREGAALLYYRLRGWI